MGGKIGIGIDTGGTYTDAVVYDFTEQRILSSAKALTTRQDLSIGILEALDKLPPEFLKRAELIALSTTLATNACVEGKGGRAKLIFLGGDKKVINEFGGKYGLPPAEDMYIQESYTKFSGVIEREPDWELFTKNIQGVFNHLDGAGILEIYAMKNNAVLEKKAKELFQGIYDIPVVCGHELFSDLNCLQRASGTLLNARLFPVIAEFLEAIKKAVAERGIRASVVIVRSDGTLMSEEFAVLRPVETLLCGPAASIAGGTWLSGAANCVIIDMGGTTTDMALVKDTVPVTAAEGISVGKWRTFVRGFSIKTFGLGGDSAVHYADNRLFLEDYRVVPLCVIGAKYPSVIAGLRKLADNLTLHDMYLHEHYLLVRDIDGERYTEQERRFCEALRGGPRILRDAVAAANTDIYNLRVSRLLQEGVVQICGLTPTDAMHIRGDFSGYSKEAALLGAEYAAFNLGISVEELCEKIYDAVKRKLYLNVVKILLEDRYKHYPAKDTGPEAEAFILRAYESAVKGEEGKSISLSFRTDFSLVGIGAPIHIFLPAVAELLGTRAIIPDHFAVANALGAVVGKIYVSYPVEIHPNYDMGGIDDYTVFGFTGNRLFTTPAEAEDFAIREAMAGAHAEALKRGARGEIALSYKSDKKDTDAKGTIVYLGTTVTGYAAAAVGGPAGGHADSITVDRTDSESVNKANGKADGRPAPAVLRGC
ncbi:MAG: hydantoinase/oxoprolinase family protein [Treponema sp.]|jgi:N-methylhydantoinase A/oxoprolinase/acetone carboxylase beta subunit|nr:hydantoinase/oxoprolinase family protein [Treponema sp.]